jgi:hypothetical protein
LANFFSLNNWPGRGYLKDSKFRPIDYQCQSNTPNCQFTWFFFGVITIDYAEGQFSNTLVENYQDYIASYANAYKILKKKNLLFKNFNF